MNKTVSKILLVLIGIVLFGVVVVALAGMYKFNYLADQPGYDVDGNRTESNVKVGESLSPEQIREPAMVSDYRDFPEREAKTTEVVTGLDAPWAFTWLPNGNLLVTERFGSLQLVQEGVAAAIVGVPEVFSAGQGGLLDVTIHPEFENNQFVYLSYAQGTNESNRLKVARAELRDLTLQNLEVIFETGESKTGSQHFGSRFAWLPDNTLLFSVGDGGNPPIEYGGELIREQAQKLTAHLGKVIRLNDDGSVPADNPFVGRPDVNPEIYSYGHRNVQGLAYDPASQHILASEHGSKGGDELNHILPGENYGWPQVSFATEYDAFNTPISEYATAPGIKDPQVAWTPTVAPSSVVVYTGEEYESMGDIFLAAMLLRSNITIAAYAFRPAGAIIKINRDSSDHSIIDQELVRIGYVRVRSIAQGPDGFIYALTDTTDRQSRPGTAAGAIVRIDSM